MIDSYSKLSIGKYLQIQDALKGEGDEIEKEAMLVSILNDMEVEDVLEMPLTKFGEYVSKTKFLTEEPVARQNPPTKFKINGVCYEVMLDVRKMNVSQFIDYQTYLKDSTKIVEIMSVFIIPEGKEYNDGYDIIEVQNIIRENINIIDAISLAFFFRSWFQALYKVTLESSIKKLKKMMKKEKNPEIMKQYQLAIQSLQESGNGLY